MRTIFKLVKAIVILAVIGVILYKIYQYFIKDDMYDVFEDADLDPDAEEIGEIEIEEEPSVMDKVVGSVAGVVDSVSSYLSDKVKKA